MDRPLINIITRFSRESSQLQVVLDSLKEQSYKNIKHIICCETKEKIEEAKQLDLLDNTLIIQVPKIPRVENLFMVYPHHDYYTDYLSFGYKENSCKFLFEPTNKELNTAVPPISYDPVKFEKNGTWCLTLNKSIPAHAEHFPPNVYFNYAHQHVDEGWIYYIDDGDKFEDNGSLQDLVNQIVMNNEDTLHVFKLINRGRVTTTPSEKYFRYYLMGHPIILNECSGSCICFHSKYKDKILWDEWRLGDYRVIKKLEKLVKKINFFDKVILHTP